MKTAIILGTSRIEGNTHKLVNLYQKHKAVDVYNLTDYCITPYDYEHENKYDDFLILVRKLLEYDHLIFATPIYWYSMSAQMKVFFDRLSDLLTIEKDLGRALRGKSCSVLATGVDQNSPICFEQPFELSASYLGMTYQKLFYCQCEDDFIERDHCNNLLSYLGVDIK